jgi:hypothetical protein
VIITDPLEYRSSAAVSFSKLKVADECPALYHKMYVTKKAKPRPDTKAQAVGTGGHCLILEGPAVFAERYAIKPETYTNDAGRESDWNGNSAVCKAWAANQRALGRTVVSAKDFELLTELREAFLSNPDAVALLSAGKPELAIRRPFPSLNLEIQGRLDWWNPDLGVVVDLKTIECLDDMPREIERRLYYRQKAFYRHLAAEEFTADVRCAIVGVEKAEPRRCGVYWLKPELLSIGDAENLASLARLSEAMKTGDWGGNPATREVGPSIELQLASAAEQEDAA